MSGPVAWSPAPPFLRLDEKQNSEEERHLSESRDPPLPSAPYGGFLSFSLLSPTSSILWPRPVLVSPLPPLISPPAVSS